MNIFDKTEDPKNISLFLMQIIIICIAAVPIAIVDIKCQKIRNAKKLNKSERIFYIVMQLLLSSLYTFAIYKTIPKFSNTFQSTLPGMFFPGVFYSLQYSMFTDLHNLIEEQM
jgi:uncharacterized BrkB/YihY/UPF0761 family membrane protein